MTAYVKEFLILDECLPGKEMKVWGWCSETGLSVLKGAGDIYGDETFEVVK